MINLRLLLFLTLGKYLNVNSILIEAQSIISINPTFITVDDIVLGHNDMAAFEFVVSNFIDNEKDFKPVRITYTLSNCNNIVIIIEYLFF